MINLEVPKKFRPLIKQAASVADDVMRPIARKYDLAEHEYPRELDLLSAVVDGMNDGTGASAGATGASQKREDDPVAHVGDGAKAPEASGGVRNGTNMSSALSIMETCRGDVGLTLALPRQGLGNAAIAAVASPEQKERYKNRWAAMAITEPEAGSDAAAIRTTATLDGDEYVLNGEKIYVTAGERAELVVVWASLDLSKGRAAIKSFVVERSNPGLTLERLEHKLGIRASDTAAFRLENCRVPKEDLLGDPEIRTETSFAGAMQTFDNTRPLVAAMAVGLGAIAVLDAEQDAADANITTFGDALWWACTTVTTVGYGDRYPVTLEGRAVAVVLMIIGIGVVGAVTASVATWLMSRAATGTS